MQMNLLRLEGKTEELENELNHLKIKQGLLSHSEQLTEGMPCPVCGSTHHPEKMKAADISEKVTSIQTELSLKRLEYKKMAELDKELNKSLTEYSFTHSRLNEINDKLEICSENIIKHQANYNFKQEFNEEGLEKAFIQAENDKHEIKKIGTELTAIEKQLNADIKNREKYQLALSEISHIVSSKTASYETLARQVDTAISEAFRNHPVSAIESKIHQINSDYQKLINEYHSIEKKLSELKPEKDRLGGIIEAKEKDYSQLNDEIDNLNEKLEQDIRDSKYKSIYEIEHIFGKVFDTVFENKKINDFENRLFNVSEQIKALKFKLANRIFDEKIFQQVLHDYDELSVQLNELYKKQGSLEKEKVVLEQNLLKKKKLIKESDKLAERSENIKTLKNLFKSNGFVNYISSVYLQNLVVGANLRFHTLTGQKLSLELTPTNDFIIRDYLNEGKTRSVKTLSGGQTFQASLSLALALADNIQSINKTRDNFFFLDEGFGSLDKESLATVFSSLKSLRKENRIVGIISHVEELQQEIDNYLRIENLPHEGSLIKNSWE